MLTPRLTDAASEVVRLLAERRVKLVIAESCTAGLAAAALGGVPGISLWFCGSSVVYRTETKIAWLGVNPPGFQRPETESVGPQTSKELTTALLARTPEADVAAAISGHLGPNAPAELDGRCFAFVRGAQLDRQQARAVEWRLAAGAGDPATARRERQQQAAAEFLELIVAFLNVKAS